MRMVGCMGFGQKAAYPLQKQRSTHTHTNTRAAHSENGSSWGVWTTILCTRVYFQQHTTTKLEMVRIDSIVRRVSVSVCYICESKEQ